MNLQEMLKKSRQAGSVGGVKREAIDLDDIISKAVTAGHIKPAYNYQSE